MWQSSGRLQTSSFRIPFSYSKFIIANMNMYLALFLAVVALSAAAPKSKNNKCPDLKPYKKFDLNRYYNGTWYMTHAKIDGMHIPGKNMFCGKFVSSILGNGTIREFVTHYLVNSNLFFYVENQIDPKSSTGKGKYFVNSRISGKDGTPIEDFFPIKYTNLGTDYKTYSVFNMCEELDSDNVSSFYFVTSRVRNARKVPPMVKKVLEKNGLKLMDFTSIEKIKCQP